MARQLLFTLSAEVKGPPGTEAGGRKVRFAKHVLMPAEQGKPGIGGISFWTYNSTVKETWSLVREWATTGELGPMPSGGPTNPGLATRWVEPAEFAAPVLYSL